MCLTPMCCVAGDSCLTDGYLLAKPRLMLTQAMQRHSKLAEDHHILIAKLAVSVLHWNLLGDSCQYCMQGACMGRAHLYRHA